MKNKTLKLLLAAAFSITSFAANAANYTFDENEVLTFLTLSDGTSFPAYSNFSSTSSDYTYTTVFNGFSGTFLGGMYGIQHTMPSGDALNGFASLTQQSNDASYTTPATYQTFTFDITYTGGTGLFEGASGTGIFTGENFFNNQGAIVSGFATLTASVSTPPVPEADTSAMLLMGVGVMGFMARRRKQLAA